MPSLESDAFSRNQCFSREQCPFYKTMPSLENNTNRTKDISVHSLWQTASTNMKRHESVWHDVRPILGEWSCRINLRIGTTGARISTFTFCIILCSGRLPNEPLKALGRQANKWNSVKRLMPRQNGTPRNTLEHFGMERPWTWGTSKLWRTPNVNSAFHLSIPACTLRPKRLDKRPRRTPISHFNLGERTLRCDIWMHAMCEYELYDMFNIVCD